MLLLHKFNDVCIGSSFMFSPRPTQQQTCVGGCIDKAWLAQSHLVSFHSWGLIWISIFPLHPTSVTSVQHWVFEEPIHFSACSWMKTLSRHLVICFKKSRICNLRQMGNPIITITVRILTLLQQDILEQTINVLNVWFPAPPPHTTSSSPFLVFSFRYCIVFLLTCWFYLMLNGNW